MRNGALDMRRLNSRQHALISHGAAHQRVALRHSTRQASGSITILEALALHGYARDSGKDLARIKDAVGVEGLAYAAHHRDLGLIQRQGEVLAAGGSDPVLPREGTA
jgi:hypothetical protein